MNHHKVLRQGFILIGFAASLLLLTITMYLSVVSQGIPSTVFTNFRQTQIGEAKQTVNASPKPHQTKPPLNSAKTLESIDSLFAHEQEIAE